MDMVRQPQDPTWIKEDEIRLLPGVLTWQTGRAAILRARHIAFPAEVPNYSDFLKDAVIRALSIAWACKESAVLRGTDPERLIGLSGIQRIFASVWTITRPNLAG
jgi:hypothetical protein